MSVQGYIRQNHPFGNHPFRNLRKLSCVVWALFGLGLVFGIVLVCREKSYIVCILALQVPVLVRLFLWFGVLGPLCGGALSRRLSSLGR